LVYRVEMGHATESLEHAGHVGHAGHGDHGHADTLSKRIGISMALLGVVLAFAAAKVGGQRTELTQALVDQQHAHAKYTQADIKHRVAVLTLQELHAQAQPGSLNARDVMRIAGNIERYLGESKLADTWVDAYDPLVEAHALGQERFELAQLAAEIGIVVASIALLLKRRDAWLASVGFGAVAIGLVVWTFVAIHGVVHDTEATAEHAEEEWEALHQANNTDATDQQLVDEVKRTYGALAAGSAQPSPP
jgi:hypothetical protein